MKQQSKNFSLGELFLITGAVLSLVVLAWMVYQRQTENPVTDFESCKAAGNPIAESYPEQCHADGKTYTNPAQKVEDPALL